MEFFGQVLFYVGAGAFFFGYVWSLIRVFTENALLGVVCLFIPLALLLALTRRWPQTWQPLSLWLGGVALFFCGLVMSSSGK